MTELQTGADGIPIVAAEDLQTMPVAEIDALRQATPLVRTHPQRVTVMRVGDVRSLASDPRLVQLPGAQFAAVMAIPDGRCASFLKSFMLMTNGAEHQTRRGAFARAFSHPVMRSKRANVRAVADGIVADLPRGEAFDFLDLCASRLPAEVIAGVLGLPMEESRRFAGQVYSLSRCLMIPYDLPHHQEIEGAAEALYGFVEETLAARRAEPRDELLSMLATDASARALPPEVLTYQVMGVILAGSDTTRSGFNMTVGRLLEDRALWNEIMADRSLIPAAVEEALRIEPPVGSMPRFVPAPLEIGATVVAGGQVVGLSTLSAMRDEAVMADPGRFDLHRSDTPQPHLVFGGGAHRCLGEMLARIEMEEGLAALMDGAPTLELLEAPRMLGFSGIRRSTPMITRIA